MTDESRGRPHDINLRRALSRRGSPRACGCCRRRGRVGGAAAGCAPDTIGGVKLTPDARFPTALHPRRPGTRSGDGRHHHAHLPDLDLRAGSAGQAQGLRVRAHAEPDAGRARGQRRRARRRRARASRSPPAWRRSARWRRCSRPATTPSSATTPTAARSACSRRCCGGQGITATYVDTSDVDAIAAAIQPTTRLLLLETPTNPMMTLTDLAAAADVAHRRNVAVVVDNTFASPALQRPLAFGCDLVLHSTTKYLNGHSDSIGGIVVAPARRPSRVAVVLPERLRRHPEPVRFLAGAARHQDAGAPHGPAQRQRPWRSPTFLAGHPKVTRVLYPGLPDHPQHALAEAQMSGFGGMLAFDMGSIDAARRVVERVRHLRARREPRRRRVADRPPGVDDARVGAAGAARRARPHRRPGPHLGGHRGHRRSDRRPGAGARELAADRLQTSNSMAFGVCSSESEVTWVAAFPRPATRRRRRWLPPRSVRISGTS